MDTTMNPIRDESDVLPQKCPLQVQEFGRETVIYDEERHKVHILNRTSYFVWKQCDGHRTFGELMTMITEYYSNTPPQDILKRSISQILEEFIQRNMVTSSTTR